MSEDFSVVTFASFVNEYYDFGKSLAKRVLKTSMKKMGLLKAYSKVISPVTDWSRFAEFFLTSEILKKNLQDGDTILDIGSPKLFPIWFATKKYVKIICTDIWKEASLEYLHFWDDIKNNYDSKLTFETADLLDLKYDNEKFDGIFSISTIEHAYDPNWKETVSENLSRVLKNNKIVVITTPFGSKNITQFKENLGYTNVHLQGENSSFFMRIIDQNELNEFVKTAERYSLFLEEYYTVNISASTFSKIIRLFPVHLFVSLGFLYPYFAIQNYNMKKGFHIAENEKYEKHWKADINTSDIVLVFRKKLSR